MTSFLVTTDIDSSEVEDVIMGSSSGTIHAIRVIPCNMIDRLDRWKTKCNQTISWNWEIVFHDCLST